MSSSHDPFAQAVFNATRNRAGATAARDKALQGVTPRYKTLPNPPIGTTKPNHAITRAALDLAVTKAVAVIGDPPQFAAPQRDPSCDGALQGVTPRDAALPNPEKRGTNPIHPRGDLTPRQLAAVRHLARGARPGEVVKGMGISRMTLSRWRRDPRFITALREAHLELLRPRRGPPV
ncbi:MAG: hypothetical protein ABIP55_07470 [Tepidisphaeraceae bacterium]